MHNNRNTSIELLRIISSIGVIILHYNNKDIGGGFKYVVEGSINQYFLYLTQTLFIVSVDLFVMISAYFLSQTQKRKFVKVVELLLQVILFRLCFYLTDVVLGKVTFSVINLIGCFAPSNYFAILYCSLYIISSYSVKP